MSPAGGLLGPPIASRLPAVDALPPVLGPQPPQQDGLHGGINRDGADGGTFSNPCLHLFLADRSTPPQRLRDLLAAAWEQDDKLTLKLICQLRDRDVGATGKGDREGFYTAALWMHEAHPHTLASNLSAFAKLGYIKDLPELLYRLVKGHNVRELEKAKAEAYRAKAEAFRAKAEAEEIQADDDQWKAARREKRLSKVAMDAKQALAMYKNDEKYRNLFNCVADFFAERLKSDLDNLQADKKNQIGLAAKWCPSVDSAFNQATLLCEGIASRLFPWKDTNDQDGDKDGDQDGDKDGDQDGDKDRWKAFAALGHLRRKVLVPLRKALQLPEIYISDGRWSEVPYERVAQLAMERYEKHFRKRDELRFNDFMERRQARRATHPPFKPSDFKTEALAADAYRLLPHYIISKMSWAKGSVYYRFAWDALVKNLKSKGLFHNCVAVCDLSKNMSGARRHVCQALGLLVTEVGERNYNAPWKNCVRPFSKRPLVYDITKTDESDRIAELDDLRSQCDDKIDLKAVFKNTLTGACFSRVGPEEMVRTIFVITNKEFDEAIARPWREDYKAVCETFTKHGFGSVVPQVIFWNLGGQRSAALTQIKDGVMRLSGFSESFFRLFLEKGGIVTPEDEMHASVAADAYNSAIVLD